MNFGNKFQPSDLVKPDDKMFVVAYPSFNPRGAQLETYHLVCNVTITSNCFYRQALARNGVEAVLRQSRLYGSIDGKIVITNRPHGFRKLLSALHTRVAWDTIQLNPCW
jgi:hypothetical protein